MVRKLSYLMILLLALLCFGACNSKNSLTPKQIVKLVNNDNAENCTDVHYCEVKTGYYELSDENERYILRQLAATGIVTYKCDVINDTIIEKTSERYLQGYSWWGYGPAVYGTRTKTNRVAKTYYFVDVQLTEAGKKIMVDSLPKPAVKDEEVTAAIDSSKMPEFSVPKEEFPKENTQEAENSDTQDKAIEEGENKEPENPSKYDLAKQKENVKVVYLKAYSLKAIIAKDVLIQNNEGIVSATASVIMEYTDITPVGRILCGKYEKVRSMESFNFLYFEDKGWTISDVDMREFDNDEKTESPEKTEEDTDNLNSLEDVTEALEQEF